MKPPDDAANVTEKMYVAWIVYVCGRECMLLYLFKFNNFVLAANTVGYQIVQYVVIAIPE